jgi:hypothetical protein
LPLPCAISGRQALDEDVERARDDVADDLLACPAHRAHDLADARAGCGGTADDGDGCEASRAHDRCADERGACTDEKPLKQPVHRRAVPDRV